MKKSASLEIWLVRHGQTIWSLEGRHTSFTDLDLTEAGRLEAAALGERLKGHHFDAIFCSPLKRACHTADLAGFTSYRITEDLVEWNYGICEGKTSDQIHAELSCDWHIYTHANITPGAETKESVQKRIDHFFAELLQSKAQKILVFTSGHIGRAIGMRWIARDIEQARHFAFETCSISILGFEHQTAAIISWNEKKR